MVASRLARQRKRARDECVLESRFPEVDWQHGPVVETLAWRDVLMPPEGNVNHRAWAVELT